MSANDPGSKSDHTSAEHHNDQVGHQIRLRVNSSLWRHRRFLNGRGYFVDNLFVVVFRRSVIRLGTGVIC